MHQPEIDDGDRGTGEQRRDFYRVKTALVPCSFFVMPFSLRLESALHVLKCFIHDSLVGLMISTRPPRLQTFCSKSEVPPGPSPVGFSSQTRSARIFPLSAASTRAVLMIQRLVRA